MIEQHVFQHICNLFSVKPRIVLGLLVLGLASAQVQALPTVDGRFEDDKAEYTLISPNGDGRVDLYMAVDDPGLPAEKYVYLLVKRTSLVIKTVR